MATLNPKALYQAACAELKVKCNSAVVKQLPEDGSEFKEWNLNGNIVGTKGVVAVLKVVSQLPALNTLILTGNNLGSPATKDLLAYLATHPGITHIDVSNNDIRLGGPELIELLKKNRRITRLDIFNTHLRPLFVRLIAIQLKKNEERSGAATSQPNEGGAASTAADGGHRFSFGTPAEGGDTFAAGEDDAFQAFQESLQGGSGGKTVGWDVSAKQGGKGGIPPRRPTVCAEVFREDEIDNFVPQVVDKDPKVKAWLMSVLERHDLFSHLEDFELSVAVDAMNEVQRLKGDVVFDEEDDEDGDLFYVIGNGELQLTHNGDVVNTLTKGATTQDLMLMYAQRHRETATCTQDVVLYTLDRTTYKCVLSKASKKKRAMYLDFLRGVPFLKSLTNAELLQLADALKPAQYEPGQALIRYGDVGENFFIIVEGIVDVFGRDDAGQPIKVCQFTVGENIGELEFLKNHKCVADCKAQGFVRAAKMNRHHFEMVMGPVKEVLARTASESSVYAYYREQLEKMEKQEEH